MSAESKPALDFEIGHVLFIDIVGYSKLLIVKRVPPETCGRLGSNLESHMCWKEVFSVRAERCG
jgi:hypothetical protein